MEALSNPFANTIAMLFADIVANYIAMLVTLIAAHASADPFERFPYAYSAPSSLHA